LRVAILICCNILCLGTKPAEAAEANVLPKCLSVFSSGNWAGWHHVQLVGDTLLYWRNPRAPRDTDSPERIRPSLASWQEFRRELDAIDIWHWHSDYSIGGIFDATAWRFEIEYADRSINTGGDGGLFPDEGGAPGPLNSRSAYERYSRYVKRCRRF
jgi:hypothetical protein